MASLAEVKREAAKLFAKGEPAHALRLYHAVISVAPLDFNARMRAADCIAILGDKDAATRIYRKVGWFCLKAGHPLSALVCARVLAESLGGEADDLLATLVIQYGQGSELVGKFAARVNLPARDTVVAPPDLHSPPPNDFVARAAARAETCTDNFDTYPEVVHAIPLLSDVSEDAFRRVVAALLVKRLPADAAVIREGEPGQSFFFIATGAVRVFDTDSLGRTTDLATLHENAIFGEMALISAQPRTASVTTVSECDLLEVGREALATLADELPAVAQALHQFTLERLLSNLMAQNPLFRPFSKVQQRDLLKRFTSHDVATGTPIIHEGETGQGLFVVLSGEVEIKKMDAGGDRTHVAALGPGSVFGEMSLIKDEATSATVTAARPSTVLFLAREIVQRMIEGIPQIRDYLESLSDDRALDNRLALGDDDEEDGDSIVILF